MKRFFVVSAMLMLAAGGASAQTVTDAEIAAALVACQGHLTTGADIKRLAWESGWEHCAALKAEQEKRRAIAAASAVSGKDVAKRLGQ